MPEAFRKSFQAFMDAEWFRLALPTELGGTLTPRSLVWAVARLVLGANPAVWMCASRASSAHALWRMGPPAHKGLAPPASQRRGTRTTHLAQPQHASAA